MTKTAKKLAGEILKSDLKPDWYLKGPNGQEKTYWTGTNYILDEDAKPGFFRSQETCEGVMKEQSEQPGWNIIRRPEKA